MSTETTGGDRLLERRGSVRWYSAEKGYGFIAADDGGEIFVRFDAIEGDGFRGLAKGERVVFVEGEDPDGKVEARSVRREI